MSTELVDAPDAQQSRSGLSEETIQRLFSRIGEISSLPTVAVQVIELAEDPDAEAADLLEVVRSDPALAMRLMRTINSSYYAVNQKVADLHQAITLMGFQEVRNLALTTYVAQLFKKADHRDNTLRQGMWTHMVGVAMVSRLLAEICGGVAPQEVYLGGLLHDVGLILLDEHLHEPFSRVVDSLDDESEICRVERSVFSFDHTDLGAHVARKWNLPEQLVAAIEHHHESQQHEGPHRDMVTMVALADFFCDLKGVTALGVRTTTKPPMELFAELGVRKEHIASVLEQLDELLKSANLMASVQIR